MKGVTHAFGAVMDAEPGRVRLWVPGHTSEDGDWLDIPPGMPEELRWPQATFNVDIVTDLASATYLPQPHSELEPVERQLRALADTADQRAIFAAFRLLALLSRGPAVAPTPDGGVELQWHRDGLTVQLRLRADGTLNP
jgi:hypothetical protein